MIRQELLDQTHSALTLPLSPPGNIQPIRKSAPSTTSTKRPLEITPSSAPTPRWPQGPRGPTTSLGSSTRYNCEQRERITTESVYIRHYYSYSAKERLPEVTKGHQRSLKLTRAFEIKSHNLRQKVKKLFWRV